MRTLAVAILLMICAGSLAGCAWMRRPVAPERPVLDRLDPEIDALARCVVIWDRPCIATRTRAIVAIRDAGRTP